MSEQGSSVHLRSATVAKTKRALAELGILSAILASNRSWTSFVPIGESALELAEMSNTLGVTALEVFFDEDSSFSLQFYRPVSPLPVPRTHDLVRELAPGATIVSARRKP